MTRSHAPGVRWRLTGNTCPECSLHPALLQALGVGAGGALNPHSLNLHTPTPHTPTPYAPNPHTPMPHAPNWFAPVSLLGFEINTSHNEGLIQGQENRLESRSEINKQQPRGQAARAPPTTYFLVHSKANAHRHGREPAEETDG